MTNPIAFGMFFLAAIASQAGGAGHLVVPTKITATPSDSFRRGQTVTLGATFAANRVPPPGSICSDPTFAVRVYDAKLVETDPPRISRDTTHKPVKPVTPYLQQSGAPVNPLPGPNATTVEKTFEPFVLPAKKTARMSRLYVGLFQICGVATPKGINDAGDAIIYDDELNGSYIGGTFFRADCTGKPASVCIYRPE